MTLDELTKTKNVYKNHVFKNGDCEYKQVNDDNTHYLIRDKVVLISGDVVWSFYNGDYCHRDSKTREYLHRDGKCLYVTEPEQVILDNDVTDKNNTKYVIRNSATWEVVKELNFPFEKSVLGVIDGKLKGE